MSRLLLLRDPMSVLHPRVSGAHWRLWQLWLPWLLVFALSAHAAPPPVAAFANGPFVRDAALSPDGRYVSWITAVQDIDVAMVKDLSVANSRPVPVLSNQKDKRLALQWCRWATSRRLLCSLRAGLHDMGLVLMVTRLVAVDPDGKNLQLLFQDRGAVSADSEFQDVVVDWTPGKPDTVLVEARQDLMSGYDRSMNNGGNEVIGRTIEDYPGVYELNVVTGTLRRLLEGHGPLSVYLADHHGNVRLGWGIVAGTAQIQYEARDPHTGLWQRLLKFEAFSGTRALEPIAICQDDTDYAYALGDHEGRDALWRIDLTSRNPPALQFSHPVVDIDGPVFASDGRLVGVFYETDRPSIYYVDPAFVRADQALQQILPNEFFRIVGTAKGGSLMLVHASSDVDAGTYYLLDSAHGRLSRLGTAYPELDPATLGRMQSISYPARDGTSIPGYLTLPPGARPEHLPLIVMPHGGPIARDSWQFDPVRAFLVSRGYAVLQMNFRGSSGYGEKWFYDAHQDWGGLTYSDIVDGARWAISKGIADPARMCIVGWSFGGYAALLGATRDSALFHCAISIAGVSDLSLLSSQWGYFMSSAIARAQIGTDSAKLRRDSPRNFAADVRIPLLLVHGDNDAQANVEQSDAMDRALTKAGKPHEYIRIKDADHQLRRPSERAALLSAVEKFLATNLPVRASDPAGK